MRRINVYLLISWLFLFSAGFASNISPQEGFPLAKGNYWIYQGKVKWSLLNTPGMISTTLRVKMEVLETAQSGIYSIALVKNYPLSLSWDEGTTKNYSLVYIIGKRSSLSPQSTSLYLVYECSLSEEELRQVTSFMKGGKGDLTSLLTSENLWLDLPLKKNKAYGYTISAPPPHYYRYCWHVESVRKSNLKKIKGIPANASKTEYELAYRSGPDDQISDYVPGVGLTHYVYVHHGSISEMDMKLLEVHLQDK